MSQKPKEQCRSRGAGDPCLSRSEGPADSPPAAHRVQVRFLGFLERLAGARETRVEVHSGDTVMSLLETLGERYGDSFRSGLFRTPGEIHTYLRIFLDDEEIQPGHRIAGGSRQEHHMELIILPIFEGGRE